METGKVRDLPQRVAVLHAPPPESALVPSTRPRGHPRHRRRGDYADVAGAGSHRLWRRGDESVRVNSTLSCSTRRHHSAHARIETSWSGMSPLYWCARVPQGPRGITIANETNSRRERCRCPAHPFHDMEWGTSTSVPPLRGVFVTVACRAPSTCLTSTTGSTSTTVVRGRSHPPIHTPQLRRMS
jgi:hypothetical protein